MEHVLSQVTHVRRHSTTDTSKRKLRLYMFRGCKVSTSIDAGPRDCAISGRIECMAYVQSSTRKTTITIIACPFSWRCWLYRLSHATEFINPPPWGLLLLNPFRLDAFQTSCSPTWPASFGWFPKECKPRLELVLRHKMRNIIGREVRANDLNASPPPESIVWHCPSCTPERGSKITEYLEPKSLKSSSNLWF